MIWGFDRAVPDRAQDGASPDRSYAELIERVEYAVEAPTAKDFAFRKAGLTRHDMRRILAALRHGATTNAKNKGDGV